MIVTEAGSRRLAKATRRRDAECSPTPPQKISQSALVTLIMGHREWRKEADSRRPGFWTRLREWLRGFKEERVQKHFAEPYDFSDCDFSDPALRDPEAAPVCLRGANLRDCVFGNVDLQGVDLRDADLTCAVLADTKNLLATQLSGANLCHAALPDGIKGFEGLAKVDDISKIASGIFISMLLSCVYVWLVNGSTFDAQLLANSTTSKLPVIQTDISIVTFYWDAPGVLFGVYLYFHVYMQRLWEAIAKLPAVFPSGETLDVKTYPWLLNDLVCRYFVRLGPYQPSLALLQTLLSVSLAWFVVPVTLLMVWGRYVRRHDGVGTSLQLVLLILAVWAGHEFYGLAKRTLKREGPLPARATSAGREESKWRYVRLPLYCCILGGALGLLSYGAMWGDEQKFSPPQDLKVRWLREHTGWLADEANFVGGPLGFKTSLDLGDGELSKKPANWDNTDTAANAVQILYWPHRNLRYVFAQRAFMAGMFLEDTHMEGANLQGADLRHAHLKNVYLQGADLRGAFLGNVLMQHVDLRRANLAGADVTDMTLDDMGTESLQGATFDCKTTPQNKWGALEQRGAKCDCVKEHERAAPDHG